MKYVSTVLIAIVSLLILNCATSPDPAVEDSSLGLSKTSVFDTPDPIIFTSSALDPGENELLGAYFEEAPPLIPHVIEDFLPIKIGENLCLECHGAEIEDVEHPIPASHYKNQFSDTTEAGQTLDGARFVCTICHVPQSDSQPLVANTYSR
jgi:cytochrome c-type protein NapB